MKLSEAIALGRVLLPRSLWDGGSYCNCALAMGLMAEGILEVPTKVDFAENRQIQSLQSLYKTWPWIKEEFTVPQGFEGFGLETKEPAFRIISRMFSNVHIGIGNTTLDHLIDWVRSVEPIENLKTEVEVPVMAVREAQ